MASERQKVMVIKGLTLIRPWPWAILNAGKRIENRSWRPNLNIGDWIAIHAGSKWSQDDADWIAATFRIDVPSKSDHVSGAIIGIAQYGGYKTSNSVLRWNPSEPWLFGPFGWVLNNVQAITSIPHKGALGLWTLHPSALEQVAAIVARS